MLNYRRRCVLVKPGLPHDEPEAVDLDPGARKCAVRTLLAPQHARIKIDGLRLVGWNPDFTNAPGHGDDDARFYDRQQAYVHARGDSSSVNPLGARPRSPN